MAALREELDNESNLIVFCRELFAQLFANVIGEQLTGVSGASAQRANILRRTIGRDWPVSLKRLVGHFQRFCKIHEDLLGEAYGGGSEERAEFHFDFMPSLLADLRRWAGDTGEDELAKAVDRTEARYDEFLSSWEPGEP